MRIFTIVLFFILVAFNIGNADIDFCAFCDKKIMENQTLFEGTHFTALLDYEPRVRGHLLLVSKRHVMKAHELSKEEYEELSFILPKVVKAFSNILHTDQYVILEKNGPSAFQNVPHVHFHLFPVTGQTWAEIFNVVPRRLESKELENEVAVFRSYFMTETANRS